jgi:type II secretory pathway pseudopilin PulG
MQKSVDEFYNQLAVEVRKPSWQRAPLPAPKTDEQDPSSAIVALLVPALQQALDRHTQELATVQLLACHAAIRRYRWEHERLPASLPELEIGELIQDPFTGAPFKYQPMGTRYRLTSAGPRAKADDPDAVDGRKPVSVD